ncbi:hypothetical protein ABFS82_04G009700 [Erythranthe guttata]|uniref:Uncharacterized protein n=1 Tax=Erythranthe guttata TaxID=4155 RepID=A0A022S3F0_ERYGU|nr:hypothetical protein MIMGU_mgv1a017209mg [Erythranthe guttata]
MGSVKFLPIMFLVISVFIIVSSASFDIKHVYGDEDKLVCCYDNHIGECNPIQDDPKCNQLCLDSECSKGGYCKVFKHKPPNHFCHCYC